MPEEPATAEETRTHAWTHMWRWALCLSDGFVRLPLLLYSNPCHFNGLLALSKRENFGRGQEWCVASQAASSLTWEVSFTFSTEIQCSLFLVHLFCSLEYVCVSRSGLLICGGDDDPVSAPSLSCWSPRRRFSLIPERKLTKVTA